MIFVVDVDIVMDMPCSISIIMTMFTAVFPSTSVVMINMNVRRRLSGKRRHVKKKKRVSCDQKDVMVMKMDQECSEDKVNECKGIEEEKKGNTMTRNLG